jgi:hypothetical protein
VPVLAIVSPRLGVNVSKFAATLKFRVSFFCFNFFCFAGLLVFVPISAFWTSGYGSNGTKDESGEFNEYVDAIKWAYFYYFSLI